MAWFILARAVFIGAMVAASAVLMPLPVPAWVNGALGAAAGALIVAFEIRLRSVSIFAVFGAVLGGVVGLLAARLLGAALLWANTGESGVTYLHYAVTLAFAYVGVVFGARRGEWLEPMRMVAAVSRRRALPLLQGARHFGDHRRPHRRHLRNRVPRRHAGRAAVRAEGTATGRRLLRRAQAEPRPARPRHPAEDPEDGFASRSSCRTRIFRTSARSTSS